MEKKAAAGSQRCKPNDISPQFVPPMLLFAPECYMLFCCTTSQHVMPAQKKFGHFGKTEMKFCWLPGDNKNHAVTLFNTTMYHFCIL